ncbi:antA/AntB antirepressor family protein [Kordiimonas sediminis]
MGRRLENHTFEEGFDFHSFLSKNGGRGRPRKDYALTLDIAN